MMSMHLTRGSSLAISSFTGKYSPQRTGFPRSFFFSKTFTFRPFSARWTAEDSPPGPPPTTITLSLRPDKREDQLLSRIVDSADATSAGLGEVEDRGR